MSGSFFWFALFPMLLGGMILTIYIFFLRTGEKKSANPENQRITPAKFINEVAQYSKIDNEEAKRIIDFVFSYFPGFNWRKNLPLERDGKMYEGNEEKAKKNR